MSIHLPIGIATENGAPHANDVLHLMRHGTLQLAALPPLSLYVHLPWCLRKCPYCDFNSHEWRAGGGALPEQRYIDALVADLDAALDQYARRERRFGTVPAAVEYASSVT